MLPNWAPTAVLKFADPSSPISAPSVRYSPAVISLASYRSDARREDAP
jgi:hypothetical protein